MPPFQWQAPPSLDPTSNIAALMLRGPDALAAGQIEAARANAAGIANSGAIMGNAIAGAGQEIARVPAQIQQNKAQQQESVLRGAQIEDVRRHQASTAAFESALKNPANYDKDGNPNNDAITKELRSKDVGAWQQWQTISAASQQHALDARKKLLDIASSAQAIDDKQRAAQQVQADYLGKLAYVGLKTLDEKPDDPLHARDTALASIASAVSVGLLDPKQGQSLNMQMAAAGPDQIRQTLASAIPPDLRAKLDKEAADTAKAKADALKAGAETDNLRKFGRPTPPEAQHVTFRLDGKDVAGSFVPDMTGGRYLYNGEDVTARAQHIPAASTIINPAQANDVKETIAGMKDGTLPPILPGRATKEYNALLAEAHRQNFNLTNAATDWSATQKHISSMNGAQQLRLNQSINALPELLDSVDTLASQWKGGKFPILNKANLALAKGGAYGQDAATIANKLDAQIADVTADLGNVYMGGNSPTDHALELAGKSLNGAWDEKVLHSMVDLARQNVTIRQNSIKHTGVAGASDSNPYAPKTSDTAPPTSAPIKVGGFTVVVK